MHHNVIYIVIGVMLVVAVVFALIWWQLADFLFPGTTKKTGQRILGGGRREGAPGQPPTVIKEFDNADRSRTP